MRSLLLVIPAIKKTAVIPDQLIKRLAGTTLIQRAIDTSLEITCKKNILVITDSEEISLICERNGINFYRDSLLRLTSENILQTVLKIVNKMPFENILLFRANTPLVGSEVLKEAYDIFLSDRNTVLNSVKAKKRKLLKLENDCLVPMQGDNFFEELKAFQIFPNSLGQLPSFKPFVIEPEMSIEIEGYQDWWVCEKVLQRKRIVFNVIGSVEIGMGHIYHSLAIAHEITDHEVLFVCDKQYQIAVDKIAATDYRVISTTDTLKTILALKPDLVINDVLDTDENFIQSLKENGIKVVNFEDLGSGSKYADLVFNDLYDTPQLEGNNYIWGHEYLALRDEFYEATPHKMGEEIKEVLITFGGTDQNNFTLLTLKSILSVCQKKNIKINIVCGSAYGFKKELQIFLDNCPYKEISLTYASGMISKIMEKSQLAISSNGRTVYELADMNIPSIIFSHHEREVTHSFATLEKGFINLGVQAKDSSKKLKEKFEKLVEDKDYRDLLFMNIKKFCFRDNKQKLVRKVLELLK